MKSPLGAFAVAHKKISKRDAGPHLAGYSNAVGMGCSSSSAKEPQKRACVSIGARCNSACCLSSLAPSITLCRHSRWTESTTPTMVRIRHGSHGQWWVCTWCSKITVAAREHNVALNPEYVRQLLQTAAIPPHCPCWASWMCIWISATPPRAMLRSAARNASCQGC